MDTKQKVEAYADDVRRARGRCQNAAQIVHTTRQAYDEAVKEHEAQVARFHEAKNKWAGAAIEDMGIGVPV